MLTVGVLGGMGPAATIDFMAKVLAAGRGASEQDQVRLIVDSNPGVLDRNAAVRGAGPSPAPELAAMARGLEGAGADFLVMACNTAHAWQPEIEAAVAIPFVSIVDEALDWLAAHHPAAQRIGLLAADGCLEGGVYQGPMSARGMAPILASPADQARFMDALYRVKAGDLGAATKAIMLDVAAALVGQGAEVILAACTEVPLLVGPEDVAAPLIDATQVLALRTVAYAKGEPIRRLAPSR
jgi:aspartate racemase